MKATGHLPLFHYLHPLTPQLGLAIETTEMGQIETGYTSNTKIALWLWALTSRTHFGS